MNDQCEDELILYNESIRGFMIQTPECIDKILQAAIDDGNFVLLKYMNEYLFKYAKHSELIEKWKQTVNKHIKNITSRSLGMSNESARMLLKIVFTEASYQCKALYQSFDLNKQALRSKYKVKHIEINKQLDNSYDNTTNMQLIDEIFGGVDEYLAMIETLHIGKEGSEFIKNIFDFFINEKWWLSSYGKGLLVKSKTKDKRYHRQILLLCPFAMGNTLSWETNDYLQYCAVGSELQNISMGSLPACTKTISDLTSSAFIVTLNDIKKLVDAVVQQDIISFQLLRESLSWSATGFGPEVVGMYFSFFFCLSMTTQLVQGYRISCCFLFVFLF